MIQRTFEHDVQIAMQLSDIDKTVIPENTSFKLSLTQPSSDYIEYWRKVRNEALKRLGNNNNQGEI
ncbi:hypothetical protein VSAK1_26515 [Vibrio mediterranei AK1]|uniref:hypothetical protein n=1 Tax=Vibrio mediterranei TaxID=689 RepID=UPI000154281D|nr:hypothetical protein [Vibrio mediterranei]EDL52181.1 hypothetical protein VSAK1_26515 [Vibrio mediterranei AK1]